MVPLFRRDDNVALEELTPNDDEVEETELIGL
jgi:hypothetical protein